MSGASIVTERCWCGSKDLAPYSEHYLRCGRCKSLLVKARAEDGVFGSGDQSGNLYNKEYWTQTEEIAPGEKLPDIFQRSRLDLPERCLYWLSKILKYRLPPGKVLEVGCAHGGLVSLLQAAGFEVTGLEMSPWIVDFGRQAFGVDLRCARIEDFGGEPGSYDAVILMDVLEHFTDPRKSLEACVRLLKPDGMLVIQTPCFRTTELSYEELKPQPDLFIRMMREWEHLTLFSEKGVKELLAQAGCGHVRQEPQLFPYDIFLFAGKKALAPQGEDEIAQPLLRSPQGRLLLALLDLQKNYLISEADRAARLEVIQGLVANRPPNAWRERARRLKKRLKDMAGGAKWLKR